MRSQRLEKSAVCVEKVYSSGISLENPMFTTKAILVYVATSIDEFWYWQQTQPYHIVEWRISPDTTAALVIV